MSEVLKLVLEGINHLFGDNYLSLIIYLSILFLSLWLYREFRNKMIEDEKVKKENVKQLLTCLIDLELSLQEFIKDKTLYDKVKEKLVNAYPYLSYDLSKKVSSFNSEMTEEDINVFIQELQDEKNKIKYNQNDSFSYVNEKSLMRLFEYHYNAKFSTIVSPFMMTIFTLLIILFFSLILIVVSSVNSFEQKLYLILATINPIIFTIFLLGLLDTAINKRLVNKWYTWALIIFLLIMFILSLIIFQSKPELSTGLFVFYLLSMFIFMPKVINKQ